MKLLSLTLKGIGPFKDEHTIDFADLSASGLFLLEGPTGAGKSTLIDAIVYALYGSVAGSESDLTRMRSHFAGPREDSFVDLLFETGHGIHRIRRTPEYQRAKARGSGTTTQQATARLWRFTSPDAVYPDPSDHSAGGIGPGEAVSTNLREISTEIPRIIGLSRDQFAQTVVLPQGEFARFLRADTAQRQQVLQRVFGTELYQRLESTLEDMRREARREVEAADRDLRTRLAAYCEAAAADDDANAALQQHLDDATVDDLLETVAVQVDDAEAAAAAARTTAETATSACDDARTTRETTGRVLGLLERKAQYTRRRRALEETAERHRDDLAHLDAAVRAAHVATADAAHAAADQRRRDAEDALAAARRSAPADLRDADSVVLAAARDTARDALTALAPLLEVERGLAGREQDLDRRGDARGQAEHELTALETQIGRRPAERETLTARRVAALEQAAALGDLVAAETTAAAVATAAATAEKLGARLDHLHEEQRSAAATATERVEIERDLRRCRITGIAGELAAGLADGDPCPVCGSTAHPRPAQRGADDVTPEDIERAERDRRAAEEALGAVAVTIAGVEASLATARTGSNGLTAADARTVHRAAQDAVTAARDADTQAKAVEQQLEQHDRDTETLRATAATAREDLARRATALDADTRSLQSDRKRVADARGDADSLETVRTGHRDRATAAERLAAALVTADQAAQRAGELAADLERVVATHGFTTLDGARAARLADDETEQLAARTRAWEVEHGTVTEALADPEVQQAEGDLDELTSRRTAQDQALREAEAAQRDAVSRSATASTTASRMRAAADGLRRAVDAQAGVRESTDPILRVATLASGGGGERIRLSTYVLMRRFDEVIAAANTRLATMSGANFELQRAEGSARGGRRTGLDLVIIDRSTDTARVPTTLSGGETFYVSLALALGLADIVTAEAGGIEANTLFVDEGFGTLDADRLDLVLREIGRLADAGRTVGIVSHVAELKTRIPEKIEVRRTSGGWSTLSIVA